ncbi:MAG: hypothetical protein ACE5I2_02375 [Anaerolineae bacterium]
MNVAAVKATPQMTAAASRARLKKPGRIIGSFGCYNHPVDQLSLTELHQRYIQGSPPDAIVLDHTILLCHLTNAVFETGFFPSQKVYINTKVLKHTYDKKPAEEYDFIIKNLVTLVRYPDHIYENLSSKRGDLGLVKRYEGALYFCSIERTYYEEKRDGDDGENHLVTAFRVRKETYLDNYKLLWSWKGDDPSS